MESFLKQNFLQNHDCLKDKSFNIFKLVKNIFLNKWHSFFKYHIILSTSSFRNITSAKKCFLHTLLFTFF